MTKLKVGQIWYNQDSGGKQFEIVKICENNLFDWKMVDSPTIYHNGKLSTDHILIRQSATKNKSKPKKQKFLVWDNRYFEVREFSASSIEEAVLKLDKQSEQTEEGLVFYAVPYEQVRTFNVVLGNRQIKEVK